MALKGSPTALRLCLERINPVMKDRPVQLDLPARKTNAHDLLAAHDALLDSVANGTLTPLEAEAVSRLVEARRRSWESVEMEDRMIQLQDDALTAKKIGPPPAKIEWVDNDPIPTQEEQDRLDELALATEEDDPATEEAQDQEAQDGETDKDKKTDKDKDEKPQ